MLIRAHLIDGSTAYAANSRCRRTRREIRRRRCLRRCTRAAATRHRSLMISVFENRLLEIEFHLLFSIIQSI